MNTKVEFHSNEFAITIHTTALVHKQEALEFIIESIHGVEDVSCYKYHISILIGKMFKREEMAKVIQEKVEEYIKEYA